MTGTSPAGAPLPVEQKVENLRKILSRHSAILISFSGGVDSSLLAAIAAGVPGSRASCAILDSPVLPRRALESALEIAGAIGISCRVIPHPVLECREFAGNPPERCYFCKKAGTPLLKEEARRTGAGVIADGLNISDLGQHRPGIRASDEEGIIHPFVDAGISKEDIREIARMMNLPFWNKPSEACLSSRIAYGEAITREKLAMVERAEEMLKDLGFPRVRVRIHGSLARIEVPVSDIPVLISHREPVVQQMRAAGFCYVTIDLEGLRSGSMDLVLPRQVS